MGRPRERYYLLADCETTGTRPGSAVLEFAAQILNSDFKPVTPITLWAQSLPSWEFKPKFWDEEAYRMHLRSGLLHDIKDVEAACRHDRLEDALNELWLCCEARGHRLILTGCSVHFDRHFLKQLAPSFESIALSHQHHDISTLLAHLKAAGYGEEVKALDGSLGPVRHRAYDDVCREHALLLGLTAISRDARRTV